MTSSTIAAAVTNVVAASSCASIAASGTIASIEHSSGRFLAAWHDDASDHNERAAVTVEGARGAVRFTLVAGLVARRIVCWARAGQAIAAGDRVGIILFGSRVDVDLPPGTRAQVRVGDRVRAGETVVARWVPSESAAPTSVPASVGA